MLDLKTVVVILTLNHEEPIRIIRVWRDMASQVKWKWTPILPGYAYRLTVTDQSRSPAQYVGHFWLETDLPQEPELTITVSGTVHAEAGK
jgi:hypothetical protein